MPNPRKPRTFIPSKYTRYTVHGLLPFWGNVRACACNVYQAAFPQEMRPGIEARSNEANSD